MKENRERSYILYNYIYMTLWKRQNYWDRKMSKCHQKWGVRDRIDKKWK